MRIDNLKGDELAAVTRRLSTVETQSPLGHSSVSKGRTRFIGERSLVVEGSAEVIGVLYGDGSIQWTGPATFDGDVDITKTLDVSADTTLGGDLTISGLAQLLSDLVVQAGGKITVGNMTIDPTISGGAITFANGGQVFTDGSTIQVYLGNGVVQVSNAEAKLQLGGVMVRLTAGGIQMGGLPTRTRALANNAVVGTVWSDPSGNLYRVVL